MRLILLLSAVVVGCASSSPAGSSASEASDPSEASVYPALVLECPSDPDVYPFQVWLVPWIDEMSALLACAPEDLENPAWHLAGGTPATRDGLWTVRIDPDDDDREVAITVDARNRQIVRVTRTMGRETPRDVVTFYEHQASVLEGRHTPAHAAPHWRLFAPTSERPYWTEYYRTADEIVTVLTAASEADLTPEPVPSLPEPPALPEVSTAPDPLADFPECRTDHFGQAFGFRFPSWVSAVGPLLGCPAEALDEPEWMLVENRTVEEVDGMTRYRVPDPNDSELEVAFDIRDGRIVRATRWMTPDAQRVVSFFRLEAALAPEQLGSEPVLSTDDRQVYAPSDDRPFWTDFYRTPEAIVLQVTASDDLAPDLEAPASGAEADDLAAGGAACDAPFEQGAEAFLFTDFDVLSARLGCPIVQALADLGLTDPFETLESPDGSIVYSFSGMSRISESLIVQVQVKQDRLAALGVLWPGASTREASFMSAKTKARFYTTVSPDLDEEAQAMWFDDDDLRFGIVVQMLPDAATLQVIDSRWF